MNKRNIINLVNMIKVNLSTLLLFELFHKAIALIFVLPIVKYIINISMHRAGIVYLSAENLKEILFNPISILLILISILLFAFYMFFEFTSIIICFDFSYKGKKINILELLTYSLVKATRIIKPNNILLIIFVLIMIPLSNLILTSGYIGKIKLPEYILDYIVSNQVLNIIYIIVMFILYICVIRWIFSLHEITLNTNSFKEARKNSCKLIKHKIFKLLIYSVEVILLISVGGAIFYYGIILLIALWTKFFTEATNLKEIFLYRCFMFKDYATILSSIVGFIVSIGFISVIYYDYSGKEICIIENRNSKSIKRNLLIGSAKLLAILILIHFESIAFSLYSNSLYNIEFIYNTTVTAHRGSGATAPENTLSAIKDSIISKSEYSEIDVQETKDGELILLHDYNFKRVAGVDKNIWDVSYEEIQTYDVGSHFDSKFKGEKIPTLNEVLDFSRGTVKLLIEIKLNGHEKGNVEEKVINVIKEKRMENQCVIASMNKEVLEKVKAIDPNIITCYLTAIAYGEIYNWDYVDIYGIESTFVNKDIIENIHENGKQIFVWTVNDEDTMKKFIKLNVDSIITDNPFLFNSAMHSQRNNFISIVANYMFK